ncbi:hypothetical protein VW35_02605 [Devosia soli]|uniref:Uncharacterized protein n=1 Tax=Devosia soli TaxID=361041 RepID=A0A0F5LFW6_9HYPH|nr:hypothetical protein [Devosia soli]KKB81074.1 hypothetical protein VW35_02605 [Devosia soli]
MLRTVAAAVAMAGIFAALPVQAQTTIGGITVPAEQSAALDEYCRSLVREADPGAGDTGATAADPTNTDGTVTTGAPMAGDIDLSQITVSDCRDAGYYTTPQTGSN